MMSDNERRRQPRVRALYRFPVSGLRGESAFGGFLVDLSATGARIRVCEGVEGLEKVSGVRIELPAWAGRGEGFQIPGRFVWFKPATGSARAEAGFAFDAALESDTHHKVGELIEAILSAAEEDGLVEHALGDEAAARGHASMTVA